jgi:ABC-type lipoprotein export system ATPase subunit
MNLIGCLDVPTSGRYCFAEKEVLEMADDELSELRNAHIGFVFQSFHLLPYATVLENVLLPSLYRESMKDGARERAVELLRLIGLEARMRFRPNRLSGGEQQRVAICRALMNDPELLLADEPTGQLDSDTGHRIMTLLRAIVRSEGVTAIVATHDPVMLDVADRVVELRDGRLLD